MSAAWWLLAGAVGAVLPPDAWSRLPEHPRLFATAERWPGLRASLETEPVAGKLAALARSRSDALLDQPAVVYRQRDRAR